MGMTTASKLLSACLILAGTSYAWAAEQAGVKCGELLKMRMDTAIISEAVDVPAGKPVSVSGVYLFLISPNGSQRSQEGNQLLLLRGAQVSKALSGVVCFTIVTLDCVVKRQRPQVVHETGLHAQTPERRSP
jgi:hypothetical protein